MIGEHLKGKESKRWFTLTTICSTSHYNLLWETIMKEISTCACPKQLWEGQELCKAPRISNSFKITCLDPPCLGKLSTSVIKAFIWGRGNATHNKTKLIHTHARITRTRTRSLNFKQKNLRASRADRTKSTSLPLFIVSLADRPILPANSTIFWMVTDSAQLPQSVGSSPCPLRGPATHSQPLTKASQPLDEPRASAAPSATLLLPHFSNFSVP